MASSADSRIITVRVEYRKTPPQVFVARLNQFVRENQPPNFTIQLRWVDIGPVEPPPDQPEPSDYQDGTYPRHPNGYRHSARLPILRGQNHCPHCLCSPCLIDLPPDFLRGYCGPHPANDEKRYRLYRLFWSLLKALGVWKDEEYLRRKEMRTVRDDKRDIIPMCIITEVRSRYPSCDGEYRDYLSTFEALSTDF